jgi:dephospho-CoA kinase
MTAPAFAVALTGGIASGKSEVAARFVDAGIPVIDADHAAREVVLPGTPGFEAVVEAFGDAVVGDDGALDRRALRQRIFNDAPARKTLETLLHPRVRTWMLDAAARADGPYVLLVVPLLAETWPQYAWAKRILLVDTPETLQIERVMARDGVDHDLATRMLAAQADRERRLALADDVIDNAGSPAALDAAVERLHRGYMELTRPPDV